MQNNRLLRWLVFVIPWLAVAAFVLSLDLIVLEAIQQPQLALVAMVLLLANWMIQALQSWLLINFLGQPISVAKSFQLLIASIFLNYLPMKPGALFRGFILNREHNIAWADYGALTFFRGGLFVLVCGIVAYIGLEAWTISLSDMQLVVVIAISFLLAISLLHPAVRRFTRRFLRGLWLLGQSGRILAGLCLMIAIQLGLVLLRLQLCFTMLGESVPYGTLLVASASASVLLLTPITPGAVGVREFGVATILATMGIPFSTGASVLILDRLILVAGAAAFGGLSYRRLTLYDKINVANK